ncbi:Cobalt-zinc-cadmium resistance protein CzcA [Aquisphaera giovannonii]|uniref:Cobalt-zinc-cadmium resistance protein CzcA n=1 Tax=Aquisphaera giovannonii TaxID=406548 RepID=A0A5B9W0M8_9BACT|nr:CusA/CzcA family heavy metal efflux RND transporter [Aquisphaera giovannonii]QEH34166.1 Cobalt-zinc-cadmium resistance protein CzcA [Aquisphaera giovannonii]
MFDALIDYSLKNRGLVILALAALACSGVYSLLSLPIDAVPDITNVQVMALTSAPALGPEEVEQFITIPVENAMNGIPQIKEVRSFSQFGISGVTIIFEDGTDIYWARQQVGERLVQVRSQIPPEFGQPEMGPIATGLGEIYQFEIRNADDSPNPLPIMDLRTLLDWEVARRLKSVPGVVEVNALGGELKTYEVELDPNRLLARGISLNQVYDAIRRNNVNAGGGYIQHNGELRVIRGVGLIDRLKELEEVVLDTTPGGTPIYVRDVATVRFAPMIRQGAATRDGRGEAVTAIAYLLAGENGRVVVDRIKEKIEEIEKVLPEGVVIEAYYDRSTLIEKTIHTVAHNLAEGGILVVVVLLVMLGNLRAGLIVASAIPLSMLFAGNLMLGFGIAGSLMSLGALDFGLIVDSAVIVIENCVSKLAHADPKAKVLDVVRHATLDVRRPVVFGVAIITMVHLPILALQGVEGKMFRPMALTVIFALTGSLLLSLTATPVLASFFLRTGASERDTLPVRWAKRAYAPVLSAALRHPWAVTLGAVLAFAASVPLAMGLGGEFIPQLDEGDLIIAQTRPPSSSLREALDDANRLEQALMREFPDEIRTVVSRIGRPEIGLEAAGVNLTDTWVMLREPEAWKRAATKPELIDQVDAICKTVIPGTFYSFSQPIELRFNELLSGVRSDLGIGIYGEDLDVLQKKADEIAGVLRSVPGSTGVKAQALGGLPFLRIQVDRDRIARYEIDAADVLDAVAALGGKVVGQVVEGQRRFALQVRFASRYRNDMEVIRTLKIADPRGRMIPLEDLADVRMEDDTYEIWRKDRQRRIMVQSNVRGRDLAGFVAEVQKRVLGEVELPRGYTLEWGGTFENLQSATHRLTIVVPLALVLIFLLLYSTFHSFKLATLIFLSVPLGAIGGILSLWLRGLNFSISAGVGFIALSGVAVLDGLVLITAIRQLVEEGEPVPRAVRDASMSRLRPILMTGLVASLGFVPMALSSGAGSEVQRPLATVVIGGLITSTLLKLIVLPAMYSWFDPGLPPHEDDGEAAPAAA